MSNFEKESYLTQQEKNMTMPSPVFNKTMGSMNPASNGSMLGGTQSNRRPEIEHIINPAARHHPNSHTDFQDNLSAFTS